MSQALWGCCYLLEPFAAAASSESDDPDAPLFKKKRRGSETEKLENYRFWKSTALIWRVTTTLNQKYSQIH